MVIITASMAATTESDSVLALAKKTFVNTKAIHKIDLTDPAIVRTETSVTIKALDTKHSLTYMLAVPAHANLSLIAAKAGVKKLQITKGRVEE
jgi:hypothetical protein